MHLSAIVTHVEFCNHSLLANMCSLIETSLQLIFSVAAETPLHVLSASASLQDGIPSRLSTRRLEMIKCIVFDTLPQYRQSVNVPHASFEEH